MEISRSEGKRRVKNWMQVVKESGINCYKNFLSTIETYMEEIVNYFIHRDSSGFLIINEAQPHH